MRRAAAPPTSRRASDRADRPRSMACRPGAAAVRPEHRHRAGAGRPAGAIATARPRMTSLRHGRQRQGRRRLPALRASGNRCSAVASSSTLPQRPGDLSALIAQGKALFAALDAIVGHPDRSATCCPNPAALKTQARGGADRHRPDQDHARQLPPARRRTAPDGPRSDRRGRWRCWAARPTCSSCSRC